MGSTDHVVALAANCHAASPRVPAIPRAASWGSTNSGDTYDATWGLYCIQRRQARSIGSGCPTPTCPGRASADRSEELDSMALGIPVAVVLELMAMGQQSAAHLGELLRAASPTPPGEQQELAHEILRCCGRVIAALSGGSTATGKKRKAVELGHATPSKRRGPAGAEAAREMTVDTTEDGYIWRKYGQKDISGCKHPRLYYRCAFRDQGCGATRRVQQSQEEPPAFVIAYYGEHTCRDGAAACQDLAMPPTVVDHGSSNAAASAAVWRGADRNMGSPMPALLAVGQRSCEGDAPSDTSQGWSPAFSSEVELDARGVGVAGADEPWTVVEFLDGFRDWESVFNSP
ncbi:hypothetical protein GUJ93_ZPchr0007g5966 [Zizania palustris]|uniref:WRKY domain-containing protein n=1 Tax=Zizania palustris TaxID=103762 RepID=A0A8J5W4D9_ZIZPA|nr:hypothetical protein GUJ93_ZPchr0007g5966 [Zizania palustris]